MPSSTLLSTNLFQSVSISKWTLHDFDILVFGKNIVSIL